MLLPLERRATKGGDASCTSSTRRPTGAAWRRCGRGAVDLGRDSRAASRRRARRAPGIFALYESLVGTLAPLIADELTEAERLYPAEWLEAAFREAAAQNARSWRYVSRILERWAIEGRDHATTERRSCRRTSRYFRGKYGRILKQRLKR